jgi:hypothetical protein
VWGCGGVGVWECGEFLRNGKQQQVQHRLYKWAREDVPDVHGHGAVVGTASPAMPREQHLQARRGNAYEGQSKPLAQGAETPVPAPTLTIHQVELAQEGLVGRQKPLLRLLKGPTDVDVVTKLPLLGVEQLHLQPQFKHKRREGISTSERSSAALLWWERERGGGKAASKWNLQTQLASSLSSQQETRRSTDPCRSPCTGWRGARQYRPTRARRARSHTGSSPCR